MKRLLEGLLFSRKKTNFGTVMVSIISVSHQNSGCDSNISKCSYSLKLLEDTKKYLDRILYIYIFFWLYIFMKISAGDFCVPVWGVISYWNNSFCNFFWYWLSYWYICLFHCCFKCSKCSFCGISYWWMIRCWLDIFYVSLVLNFRIERLILNNLQTFCFKLFSTYLEFLVSL